MNYCSINDIEDFLLITIDEGYSDTVDLYIQMTTQHINDKTSRVFMLTDDNTGIEKRYNGENSKSLFIDEAISITSIKLNGSTENILSSTSLYPNNTLYKDEVIFNQCLHETDDVVIQGDWAFSDEVPLPIKWACTVLSAQKLLSVMDNSGNGTVKRLDIRNYKVEYLQESIQKELILVNDIIKQYKRLRYI